MNKKLWLIIGVALALRLFLAPIIWHPDINNHVDWGIRFWQYGPAKFYAANVWNYTWPNQPPGTIYMFAAVRKLFEFVFQILWTINIKIPAFPSIVVSFSETNLYQGLLKLPAILSDLGIGVLIYKIIKRFGKKEKLAVLGFTVWLFNPVIWYNSAVWGQYDAVINFLALLSFYLLINKKLPLSMFVMTLSIYTKVSLLIFLPIYAVIALRQKYNWKKWVVSIGISLAVVLLATLPFSNGNPVVWLFYLFKDKIFGHQLQIITANAFNIWAAITGISERPQTLPFLGLTYQYWSYILFGIFYIPCLWAVFKKQEIKTIIWAVATAAFASFMLLTNMHERYLYPFFPYFTILVITNIELFANYIAVSIISLLNLYNFWWIPAIPGVMEMLSAKDRLLPRIFGATTFLLFIFFYMRFVRYNLFSSKVLPKSFRKG